MKNPYIPVLIHTWLLSSLSFAERSMPRFVHLLARLYLPLCSPHFPFPFLVGDLLIYMLLCALSSPGGALYELYSCLDHPHVCLSTLYSLSWPSTILCFGAPQLLLLLDGLYTKFTGARQFRHLCCGGKFSIDYDASKQMYK